MTDTKEIQWHDVTSSNISALSHEGNTLFVKFKNNAVYSYANVPKALFIQILEAASVGRTFNELIKSNPVAYPWERA